MANSKIKILPAEVANRIAAGEVVERPASVLKELLENSLDAGASRINVDIEAAGSRLIRVADNGQGMNKDDLVVCLARHATSKLKNADDLERILSLGFRGEALPSIASVSRMRIRSRQVEAGTGWEMVCQGGLEPSLIEAGSSVGTLVEVKDLFFNIPARRKFLKTPATESAHLATALIRLALARPEVGFYYTVNNQNLYQLPANSDLFSRIGALLGRDVLEHLVEVDQNTGPLKVTGFIALPSLSKPNADQVYAYINGRFVRDKVILHALSQAYHELLPHNRRPVAVLHIEMEPSLVDVNVHPAKIEVRFRDSGSIHQALSRALRASLNQGQLWGGAALTTEPKNAQVGEPPLPADNNPFAPIDRISSFKASWKPAAAPARAAYSQHSWSKASAKPEPGSGLNAMPAPFRAIPMFQPVDEVRALSQLHGLYLLASYPDGLLIVDQHAAHERLTYEELKQALEQGEAPGQALLSPQPLQLSPMECALLEQAADSWLRLGLEVVPFGPSSWAVQAVPPHWAGRDVAPLVGKLLAELSVIQPDNPEFLQKSLRSMACHSSVLQGMRLSLPAMQDLLDRLFKLPPPLTCPHGRPIVLQIGAKELLRGFQRI